MANRRFIDFPIASTVGDNDIVLIWQDGANKQTTKATILNGLPENLEDLNDVVISGLTNGQILRYDSVTGKWVNTDQGNLDLNDLNDVSIVSPSNGQVLVYNSSTSKWENSSGGFVPYVGAVTTVDLGAQGLRAGYVRFDTSVVTVPDEQGLMYWDDSRSTAALIMNGTLQHIGQDTFFYVKNSSGSNIAKGTCVRFAGTDGASGHILVAPFLANGSVPSSYFMGVTSEAIANGAFGQVMHFGELEGINTSGFTAGALLYASTTVAGGFQTTAPIAPNNIVLVAAAINSKNNGAIIVRPQIGSNINNDEGVKITSIANLDLLQYQSGTGLWENKTLAQVIGSAYVPSTRTITINGTTQDLSANRTFNVGTVTSVTATSPMTSTGGTTPNLEMPAANTGVSGYLTFPDWNTFNGKVGISANGQTNYIAKFSGTNTITNSQIIDNGTNVGIGTSSPVTLLHLNQASSTIAITLQTGSNFGYLFNDGTNIGLASNVGSTGLKFLVNRSAPDNSLSITSGGNLLVGTTSDNGARLQVSGAVTAGVQSGYSYYANHTSAYSFLFSQINGGNTIAFDNSGGNLQLYTGGVLRATLNTSGNLGLGVTPSSWTAGGRNIEVGSAGNIIQAQLGQIAVIQNATFDAGWKYSNNGFASFNLQTSGQHQWFNAPSGTAGNAISFTQAMTLNASGNLLVGTTTDNGARLQVSGNVYISRSSNPYLTIDDTGVNSEGGILFKPSGFNSKGGLTINYSTAEQRLFVGEGGNSYFQTFYTNGSERLRITSSGNVGIGTASPIGRLTVSSDQSSNNQHINILGTQSGFSQEYTIGIPASTKDFRIYDLTANVERMRITSGGNVLIGTTTNGSSKLKINGLPTSSAGLASGDVWNDSGTLKIA